MQKHVNLVDLVKSFPTNIFLQNLASIQQRTSAVKFDHLGEKSENGSVSNLSTKVSAVIASARSDAAFTLLFSVGKSTTSHRLGWYSESSASWVFGADAGARGPERRNWKQSPTPFQHCNIVDVSGRFWSQDRIDESRVPPRNNREKKVKAYPDRAVKRLVKPPGRSNCSTYANKYLSLWPHRTFTLVKVRQNDYDSNPEVTLSSWSNCGSNCCCKAISFLK